MVIQENVSLQARNTFGLESVAQYFAAPSDEAALREALSWCATKKLPLFVLGGGSNIILAEKIEGLVLQPALKGIQLLQEDAESVIVEAAAGENWHNFVQHTLAQGWYGLENLSLIPGSVGAAPIQNIGAYGVEVVDYLYSVTALNIATGELHALSNSDCQFGYRNSIFKQEAAGRYIITNVQFRLLKSPKLKIDYGDIRHELSQAGIEVPTPLQVAAAVIAIRQRKLPDPAVIGNAGSFFKNPVISQQQFEVLKQHYPQIVAYPQGEQVKLAAGWLIEQAGWKGRRLGAVGSYEKQALVLVNHGGATGKEVIQLAQVIQKEVADKFGVTLEIEPNLIR